jgi:hypothetical protein
MKFSRVLPVAAYAGVCAATPAGMPEQVLDASEDPSISHFKIPTRYQSAILGRRVLAKSALGVISTVFPDDVSSKENRPSGLGGLPIGLSDYIADCEDDGNPTILSMTIATFQKNVAAGSNVSVAVQWTPPYLPKRRIKSVGASLLERLFGSSSTDDDESGKDPIPYSAANLPRFSLVGYLEEVPMTPALTSCYVRTHPDAKFWLPGNPIHESFFSRLVVQQVYWIGGFGDRAYIGWLDPEDWKSVTREEWESVELPGETKDWNEWVPPYSSTDL